MNHTDYDDTALPASPWFLWVPIGLFCAWLIYTEAFLMTGRLILGMQGFVAIAVLAILQIVIGYRKKQQLPVKTPFVGGVMLVLTYVWISVAPPSLLVDAYLVNKYQPVANDVLQSIRAAIPDADSKFGLGDNRLNDYLPSPTPAGLEHASAHFWHSLGYVLFIDQIRCTLPLDSDITTCAVHRDSK